MSEPKFPVKMHCTLYDTKHIPADKYITYIEAYAASLNDPLPYELNRDTIAIVNEFLKVQSI